MDIACICENFQLQKTAKAYFARTTDTKYRERVNFAIYCLVDFVLTVQILDKIFSWVLYTCWPKPEIRPGPELADIPGQCPMYTNNVYLTTAGQFQCIFYTSVKHTIYIV